jgi:hypothetical protein
LELYALLRGSLEDLDFRAGRVFSLASGLSGKLPERVSPRGG